MRFALAAALLASSIAAAAPAATVLDFNSTRKVSDQTGYVYGDYSEKGYTVMADECTDSNTCFIAPYKTSSSLDPNSASLVTQINPATVTVLKDNGSPFLLNSIDIADYYGNFYNLSKPTDTIRFTFTFADNSYTMVNYTIANTAGQWVTPNTLTFNLAPLVSFSFLPLAGAQIQFDNITLSDVSAAPVPEASTWALMLAGFGLTGAALRRRRAIAATA